MRSRRGGEFCLLQAEKQARHLRGGLDEQTEEAPLQTLVGNQGSRQGGDRTEPWYEKVAVCQHQSPAAVFLMKADPSLS